MHLSFHTRSAQNVGLWVKLFWHKWLCFKKQNGDGPCWGGMGQSVKGAAILCPSSLFSWLASSTRKPYPIGEQKQCFCGLEDRQGILSHIWGSPYWMEQYWSSVGQSPFLQAKQEYVEALGELSQVLLDPYLQQNMKGELLVVSVGVCWGEFRVYFDSSFSYRSEKRMIWCCSTMSMHTFLLTFWFVSAILSSKSWTTNTGDSPQCIVAIKVLWNAQQHIFPATAYCPSWF